MADRTAGSDHRTTEARPRIGARLRAFVRSGDTLWLGATLLFFAVQWRETLLLTRHWLFGDNSFQNFPWHWFVWEGVREGGLTGPCAAMGLGMPLFTEPQVQAFYPLNTAWWPIADPFASFTLKLLLHILLLGIGMYVLARTTGRSPMAACGAAVLTIGGAFIVHRIVHAPLLCSMAWSPWVIALFLRAQRSGTRADMILLGIAIAGLLLAGQPQPLIYVLPACLILAPAHVAGARGWTWRRPFLVLAAGMCAAILLAAVQVFPTLERTLYTSRATGVEYVTQWGCSLSEMPGYVLGSMQIAQKWEKAAFPGSLGLLGALYCGIWLRDRRTKAWLAVIALGLVFAWVQGNPLYLLLEHVPVFGHFRAHSRSAMLLAIGAAMLFARMLDEGNGLRWSRVALLGAGMLVALELLSVAALGRPATGPTAAGDPMSWQLPALIAVVAIGGIGAARPRWSRALLIATLMIAGAEALLLARGVNPTTTSREWLQHEDRRVFAEAAAHHQREGGAFLRWADGLPSDVGTLYHLPYPRAHAGLIDAQQDIANTILYGPNPPEVLAAYGVRWLADRKDWAEKRGYEPLGQVGTWRLYRNPLDLQVAYIPREALPGGLDESVELVRGHGADPRNAVTLPPQVIGEGIVVDPNATLEVLKDTPTEVVVRTRSVTPLVVVLTRGWSPFWYASISGEDIPCLRAHLLLLAAAVPAGGHEVRFSYETDVMRTGAVSALTLVAIVALLIHDRRRRPRPTGAPTRSRED